MIVLLKKNWLLLVGMLVGALGGFFYWFFIGCSTGTCVITSTPFNSSLFGLIMGGMLFSIFKREKNKSKYENDSINKNRIS